MGFSRISTDVGYSDISKKQRLIQPNLSVFELKRAIFEGNKLIFFEN